MTQPIRNFVLILWLFSAWILPTHPRSAQIFPGAERIVQELGAYPAMVTIKELQEKRIVQVRLMRVIKHQSAWLPGIRMVGLGVCKHAVRRHWPRACLQNVFCRQMPALSLFFVPLPLKSLRLASVIRINLNLLASCRNPRPLTHRTTASRCPSGIQVLFISTSLGSSDTTGVSRQT